MLKKKLERLYSFYNSRRWVHPDPLEFLYLYTDTRDREVVALIASSLAYGRVAQILKSVSIVLEKLGPAPHRSLKNAGAGILQQDFCSFKHRFTTGDELCRMLAGIKRTLEVHGSLRDCFLACLRSSHESIVPALSLFVRQLKYPEGNRFNSLLPSPEKGSACKRLNLFLRWMVRSDRVDPGGWNEIGPHKLIVPLDTHMHWICRNLGLTARKSADMRTVMEITRAFRAMQPDDPVRYDFALTRLGIRHDEHQDGFNTLVP